MGDPVAVDGPPENTRCSPIGTLRSVPPPVQPADAESAELADELAAALRAIRGFVPDRIWWEAGPAHALLAYQALQAG